MPSNRGAPRQRSFYRKARSDTSHKAKKVKKELAIDVAVLKAEKKALVHEAKSVPCVDCDYLFPIACMDLDHCYGEKVDSVSTLAGDSKTTVEELEAEIAKCEPVCATCHRIRTYARR